MEKKLDFGSVLSQGFLVGMKNLPSLLGAIVLWLLTIWIPYVNGDHDSYHDDSH